MYLFCVAILASACTLEDYGVEVGVCEYSKAAPQQSGS